MAKRVIDTDRLSRIIEQSPIQEAAIAPKEVKTEEIDSKQTSRLVNQIPMFVLEVLKRRGQKFSAFAREAIFEKLVRDGLIRKEDAEGKHPYFTHRF